jgi:flagellar motor switch protein FliM
VSDHSEATVALVGSTTSASALISDTASRTKPFDLRRQETIERARLRRLQPMLESVAHRLGGSLSSALRQPVRVELNGLDQATWEDYASSLPEPTFLSSAVLLPFEGRSILHVPVQAALVAIDYYLGGDGLNQPERNQLTEMERSLIGGLVEDLWNEIPQPFASFLSLTPAMVATASNAVLVQVGRPGVLCVITRLRLAFGDANEFELELCIPATIVRSLIDHVERHQSGGALGAGADRQEVRRRLLNVFVEVKLAYPPIGLTPSELLGLCPGDVIRLGHFEPGAPQALPLTLDDVFVGTGILVENGNRLSCTIVSKKEHVHEQ